MYDKNHYNIVIILKLIKINEKNCFFLFFLLYLYEMIDVN